MDDSPYRALKDDIAKALAEAIKRAGYDSGEDDVARSLDFSKGSGDMASAISLRIAKSLGRDPNEVSSGISNSLEAIVGVSKVDTSNGFINFHIDRKRFSSFVLKAVLKNGAYCASGKGGGNKVIIESPSVNPVHPWHVGQVRSALLGDTLSKIFEACGYAVERQDYIDDLGFQAAQAIWGLLHLERLGIALDTSKKYDHALGEVYVKVNAFMENNDIKDEINETLKNMEIDGTYESKISRESSESYVNAEYMTAFAFNIFHDVLVWESDIVRENLLEKSLQILKSKGIAKELKEGKYANCLVIDFNDIKDLPDEFKGLKESIKVLVRSNGAPNYLAKDIAFHMWKFGLLDNTFKYSRFMDQPNGKTLYSTSREGSIMNFGNGSISINTIDARQSYEQNLIKMVLEAIGEKAKASGFRHIAYGVVELENAKLAGRKGTWVGYTADDLLKETYERAVSLIGTRFNLAEGAKEKIARDISVAAIRFEFLKLSQEKKLTFSWESALNFEGNSGPYCQYMYARATRIIENSGIGVEDIIGADTGMLDSDHEFALIKQFSIAKDIVEKAASEYKTNVIIDYISGTALAFSKFYEHDSVLKADSKERMLARLALVLAFKKVIGEMLAIAGINAVERM